MPIGSLGIKVGMTQIFDEKNVSIPVTLIKVGPCTVTQIKTITTDGYNAVQLGFGLSEARSEIKKGLKKSLQKKPLQGHLKKSGLTNCSYLKEYHVNKPEDFVLGQTFDIDSFSTSTVVDIKGKTIGKGFTGTVKKHNFGRGPMSHGSKNHRAPGSIGAGSTPGRVYPGKRMAGRLGGKPITIKNLSILKVDKDENLLLVKGSVPGKLGNLLNIIPCMP
uniref:Large ribosomal subunit protein uL3c n=1 Tax=Pseudellipsoidion edaphicum TaxID=1431838 RepID=A0A410D2M7_9STRA|nr:ribosomal protein L3 [Pseudellipsoidion edaphicum]QAA11962.1 ribosomal protein L3 [Pseudellipsoidion edaphicum]